MNKVLSIASMLILASSYAMASESPFLKVCHGISDQGSVEVQISKSNVPSVPISPLEGYFKTAVLMNGKTVYSTDYVVYYPTNDEYFTSGSSEFMIYRQPGFADMSLYMQVRNNSGALIGPNFNTLSVVCQ